MSPTRYALISFRALLASMWSVTAAATVITTASVPADQLDSWLVLWSFIVSTLAAGTALSIRISNFLLEQDKAIADGTPGTPFTRPWLFAISHMFGSWLTGMAAFLYGHGQNWDLHYMLFAVLVASFGGAKLLEKAAEKVFPTAPFTKGGT
jgi:hypothetical protein